MKLNNKGFTLVEIIVSMALISIVLIFIYRLLIDVNDEYNNNTFAIKNQQIRAEILKNIESNLKEVDVKTLTKSNNTITINGKSITYSEKEINFDNNKWTLPDGTIEEVSLCQSKISDNNYIYKIKFIITTSNQLNTKENNNNLDDIIIILKGKNSLLEEQC